MAIPGGKIDPGETPDAAVLRELQEEVGIVAEVTGALPEVEHQYDHAHVRLHPRLCRLLPDSPPPTPIDPATSIASRERLMPALRPRRL